MFWGEGPGALNFFQELTIQVRVVDAWFNAFLGQCRLGALEEDMYNFLTGLPTQHAGSWSPTACGQGTVDCGRPSCSVLPAAWNEMAQKGASWTEMQALECDLCKEERARRNRLVLPRDPRLNQEPFLSAPYIHQNNEPKYHAMLLRAVEQAKRGAEGPKHILWIRAQDRPHNPQDGQGMV